MAKQQPQDRPPEDPKKRPDEDTGLTGLKRAWWTWARDLFHRAERYKDNIERMVPGVEWRAKQVDGRNLIVFQKKGAKRPTEPFVFKVGEEEFTLLPGQSITITSEVAEALFGTPRRVPVLPTTPTTAESVSVEEDDMPLNDKDWEGINRVLDQKFEQHKPTIENISFTGKQMLVLAGSIVSAAILIGGSILGGTLFLNNSLNKMASRIDVLDTKIDERLPTKLPEAATSTDTRSSTPPTATDDP